MQHKRGRLLSRTDISRLIQQAPRQCQCCNHVAVPDSHHLVINRYGRTPVACRQQTLFYFGITAVDGKEVRFKFFCERPVIERTIQHIPASHFTERITERIATFGYTVTCGRPVSKQVILDCVVELLQGPGVVNPFLHVTALFTGHRAVSAERGIKTTLPGTHFSHGKIEHLPDVYCVFLIAATTPGKQTGTSNQRLVIEHLLKVRHPPFKVGGITMEAPTELVINTAINHLLQCKQRHVSTLLTIILQQKHQPCGLRKFWCRTEAALQFIIGSGIVAACLSKRQIGEFIQRRGRTSGFSQQLHGMSC